MELSKYSSLSIIREQKTVGIANRSKSDPGIVFGFMVPAGQIHLKCSILQDVKIPGRELSEDGSYYTEVWRKDAYYQCTSDIVNVQADTAVYVGHVHLFDKLDKTLRKGGLIGIKSEDWTEEYKAKDASILFKLMFQINRKVERYRKLCNNHKVHLPKFTPENWRLEWPSEEEIKKARDNSINRYIIYK